MCTDWEMSHLKEPSRLMTDASAARSIAKREGAGKLRHINVRSLWLQQRAVRQELAYEKISGKLNPADGLTKQVKGELIADYAGRTGVKLCRDRAKESLKLSSGSAESSKKL